MTRRHTILDFVVCLGCFVASASVLNTPALNKTTIALGIAAAFWCGLVWGMSLMASTPLTPFALAWCFAFGAESGIVYAGWRGLPSGSLLSGCIMSTVSLVVLRKILPVERGGAESNPIVCNVKSPFQTFSPRQLLDLKLAGVVVETEVDECRRVLRRAAVEKIRPLDLLTSGSHRESRAVMAIQAIYSNLIGITFLVLLSPFLLVVGLLTRIAAGPGPVFDKVECAGFQGVPFFRRSFRTTHALTGKPTRVGKWLTRMRLRSLPQLINLVRGEMALFGPQPVRKVFADRLESVPIFARRLSVKPGILGWAQAHTRKGMPSIDTVRSEIQEEVLRISYDLHYLKFGSPLMDLEIFGRTLLRSFLARGSR